MAFPHSYCPRGQTAKPAAERVRNEYGPLMAAKLHDEFGEAWGLADPSIFLSGGMNLVGVGISPVHTRRAASGFRRQ